MKSSPTRTSARSTTPLAQTGRNSLALVAPPAVGHAADAAAAFPLILTQTPRASPISLRRCLAGEAARAAGARPHPAPILQIAITSVASPARTLNNLSK